MTAVGRAPAGRGEINRLVAALPAGTVRTAGDDVAFEAPWEIRAFALAVAAHQGGMYGWPVFQRALVASIAADEAAGPTAAWSYYTHWVEALEAVLGEAGVVGPEELDDRTRAVLATPRDRAHQRARRQPVAVDRPTS